MEGILHTFGIDVRLIIIQIINFGLLAVALWYFLYTPILAMLNEREEKIKKGVQDAENAENALAQADEEKKSILTEAHKSAEEVGVKAKAFAEEKSNEIIASAQTKASNTLAEAETKSSDMKERALKESEAEIAKLSILAAEKVLREKSSQ